jgi:Protein of unknown function (DUF2974)
MATDPILLRAILSMDAYNRGYGAGIKNLVGEATLSTDSALTPSTAAAQAAGFYAAAYTVGSQTIISYRGTDGDPGDYATDIQFSAGFGDTAQSRLAVTFYKSVIGVGADPRNGNVILTGHSLGGGLAGYVGALFGRAGSLFDIIAFEAAALDDCQKTSSTRAADQFNYAALRTIIYGNQAPCYPGPWRETDLLY